MSPRIITYGKYFNGSLHFRLLFSGFLLICLFLAGTIWLLDSAYREQEADTTKLKLQHLVYNLLNVVNVDSKENLHFTLNLPDQLLLHTGSGLYAVASRDGKEIWHSPSLYGIKLNFALPNLLPGILKDSVVAIDNQSVRMISLGEELVDEHDHDHKFTFHVLQVEAHRLEELQLFRHGLISSGIVLLGLLIVVQYIIINWGLGPIYKIRAKLLQIEQGQAEYLEVAAAPVELETLIADLNKLLRRERETQQRYYKALGDLAHSCKTPLAVLTSTIENSNLAANIKDGLHDEVMKLQELVNYHLKRARFGNQLGLVVQTAAVRPIVEKILGSMQKVYQHKAINFTSFIADDVYFRGASSDLYEVLGNIIENAYKWAQQQIILHVKLVKTASVAEQLQIVLEDDGPGISAASRHEVLQRGQRLDEQTAGHGIGLSIVADIVNAYAGSVELAQSERLGGLQVAINMPK